MYIVLFLKFFIKNIDEERLIMIELILSIGILYFRTQNIFGNIKYSLIFNL